MSEYVSLDHRDAIYTMLAPLTAPPTSMQIFRGQVTVSDDQLEYPYLVVWAAPGRRDLVNLTGNSIAVTTTTQITATGRDEDEVLANLDLAAALVAGKKPALDSRTPGFIRQVNEDAYVSKLDDVHTPEGQPIYQGVAQFAVQSTAAPAA